MSVDILTYLRFRRYIAYIHSHVHTTLYILTYLHTYIYICMYHNQVMLPTVLNHYPMYIGDVYIAPISTVFYVVWKLIQLILDDVG
jgi:hypothetical protein